jgi:flagellar motor switch protein FliM
MLDQVETCLPIDLLTASRTPQLRSLLMESLAERFMRQIGFALFQRIRQGVQLQSCVTDVVSHDSALSQLPSVMLGAVVELLPLRGRMLIIVDGALIGAVVDAMCGAATADPYPRGELSSMETRIGRQIIDLTMTAITEVLGGLAQITLTAVQYETTISMLVIAEGQEWMIAARGHFDTPVGAGTITVIVPHQTFEPLEARATSPGSMSGRRAADIRWESQVGRLTDATPLALRFELVRARVPIGLIEKIRPGQILPCTVLQEAICSAEGIDLFHADYGQSEGYVCCRPKIAGVNKGDGVMLDAKTPADPGANERVELEALQAIPRSTAALNAKGMIERVPVLLTVELGRTSIPVKDLRQLRHGQVVMLDQMVGEPLGIFANGHRLGYGEVVAVGRDQYGIRVTGLAEENERAPESAE